MKKTLCMLLTLCLLALAPAAIAEALVSGDVDAPVGEAWFAGDGTGLIVDGDTALPADDADIWNGEGFDVAASDADAEGYDIVAVNPAGDEAAEELELDLSELPETATEGPVERAEPVTEWIEVPELVEEIDFPKIDDDRDPDDLFAVYARRILYGNETRVLKSTNNAGRQLSGKERIIYVKLKEAAEKIAKGCRASTIVEIPIADLLGKEMFTAAELGIIMEYDENGRATSDSVQELKDARDELLNIDYSAISEALWADCTYELYWLDRYKTGISRSYYNPSIHYSDAQQDYVLSFNEGSCVSIKLPVLEQYQSNADRFTINTSTSENSPIYKAAQARSGAKYIVNKYANCSDFAKLFGYAQEICKLVTYNDPAAGDGWDYTEQNPWKLIWVFDGDPETNVVCEGYAMAFSYLCELSSFDSGIRCYLVGGEAGEGHAWNVVRMDDGKNYVVDVTWTDGSWANSVSGITADRLSAIENSGNWFLVGGTGTVSGGYTITTRNGGTSFRSYDEVTIAANPASALTLANHKYVPNGFQRINGDTYYFDDGAYITGVRTIDHIYFDFGDDGVLHDRWTPGWQTIDGKRYYFEENGLHTEHTVEDIPAVPATCTETGLTAGKRCTVCGVTLVEQDVEPALGHAWGMPVYTLAENGSTMTASRACLRNGCGKTQSETVKTTAKVTRAATCTENGAHAYTAEFSNDVFSKQTRTLDDILALGHDWETTYEWIDNYNVNATRICKNDASHKECERVCTTSAVALAPTCTVMGKTTYTATFTNAGFAAQRRTVEDIPATGHSWNTPSYTWASDGSSVTARHTCKNDASHVETETVKTTPSVALAPTCTEKGQTLYTGTFTNTAFVAQSKALTDIPATGHSWKAPTYTWASDYSAVTAKRVCANDADHVETETAKTIAVVALRPTCTAKGKATYTAEFSNIAFDTQSQTRTSIPALGHAWADATYRFASDYSTATATRVCKHDETHTQTQTVKTTAKVTTKPTCTAKGKTTYTAKFTKEGFTTKTLTVKNVPALGHTPVTDKAVAATYTKTGRTEGSHCDVCGKVLVAQKTTPKLTRTSLSGAKITVSKTTYTGKAAKPTVKVVVKGKTLKKGTDYTVTCTNKAIGKATATIKGKGAYKGTRKVSFSIVPRKITGLKLTAGKKLLNASWTKATGITGYQIQYGTKSSFSGARTLTLSGYKTVKAALKNLKADTKYYVRIRAYKTVSSKKYYSDWSAVKYKKTK